MWLVGNTPQDILLSEKSKGVEQTTFMYKKWNICLCDCICPHIYTSLPPSQGDCGVHGIGAGLWSVGILWSLY